MLRRSIEGRLAWPLPASLSPADPTPLPVPPLRRRAASRLRAIRSACLFALVLAAAAAQAQPSAPWTPDAPTRAALARLADDAGLPLPLTHWPLPRRAVREALDRLPAELPPPLAASRAQVEQALARDAGAGLRLVLRSRDEGLAGYGDEAGAGSVATLRSAAHETAALAWRVGVRVDDDPAGARDVNTRLADDSVVAVEGLGWQLQAGAQRAWWGPGWQSSLAWGSGAPPVLGVGLQRATTAPLTVPWLAWLGPWQFGFFVGRLDGHDTPRHPWLVAQRLTFRPLPSLEIGLTRTMQWGGDGRDMSMRSFLRAMVGRGSNIGPSADGADPANSLAGFDLRWRCPAGWPCAVYTQALGEDEAGDLPSKWLALYGVEAWSADGRHRGFVEFAETGCRAPVGHAPEWGCAYRNHAYPDGYTQGGRWLSAAVGPDARLLTIGWQDVEQGHALRLHAGRVGSRIGRFGGVRDAAHSGELWGLGAQTRWRWGTATVTPAVDWLRIDTPTGRRTEARIGATLDWPIAAF